jgi:hypothetical protein
MAQHAQEMRAAFVDDLGADLRAFMFAVESQPQLSELCQTISFNSCKTQYNMDSSERGLGL